MEGRGGEWKQEWYIASKILFMRHIPIVLFAILLLSAGASRLQAQSLNNTAWKFYVEQLHDTLTMHLGTDSSHVTTSTGETVIRSTIKVVKDTLKIKDFEGQYACPDLEGVYRLGRDGDVLSFFLVADPCNDRAEVLNGLKMYRKEEQGK
jgi:hypothetical protein